MLCTFTTEHGSLVIRSDDIRAISDGPSNTIVRWESCGSEHVAEIIGTAAENRDRIQQEELDLIGQVESHRYEMQRRLQAGYPVPPVQRGRQAT